MGLSAPPEPLGWRYLFYDLLTNAFIAELPLIKVTFESWLGGWGPGAFSAELPIGDPRVRSLDWRRAVQEGRTAIVTECDSEPLACHALWDTTYDLDLQTIQLQGTELWSYFSHRYLPQAYAFIATEQLDIARHLMIDAMAQPHSMTVEIDPVGTLPSGVLRDRPWPFTTAVQVAAAVDGVSKSINGFDYRIQVWRDLSSGALRRKFITGYPRLGRPVSGSGLELRFPGNIQDVKWPRMGSAMANRCTAIGGGSFRENVNDVTRLGAGWPLLEYTRNYSVTNVATLLDLAAGLVFARRLPITQPTITVLRSDLPVSLGSLQLGDDGHVMMEDPAYWPGPWDSPDDLDYRHDATYRLVGLRVTPATDVVGLVLYSQEALTDSLAEDNGTPVVIPPTPPSLPPTTGGGGGGTGILPIIGSGGGSGPGGSAGGGQALVDQTVSTSSDGPHTGAHNFQTTSFTVPDGCTPDVTLICFGSVATAGTAEDVAVLLTITPTGHAIDDPAAIQGHVTINPETNKQSYTLIVPAQALGSGVWDARLDISEGVTYTMYGFDFQLWST